MPVVSMTIAGLAFGLVAVAQQPAEPAALPVVTAADEIPAAAAAAPAVSPAGAKRLRDFNLPGLEKRITLQTLAEPMDVVQLIEVLAHQGGLNNIVIGSGVSGLTAKLKFENVSIADALDVVLSMNNLAYEIDNGILKIMTDAEYQRLHGESAINKRQIRIVDLKYANPERVATMLAAIKSTIGTVVSDAVTGTLILIDTPEKIAEMESVIQKSEIPTVQRRMPTETRTYTLQYADPDEIKVQLTDLLTKEVGSLRLDKRTRTLMVTDLPLNFPKIEDLISRFDAKPRQVFIESKVVAVRMENSLDLGIDWQHIFEGVDPRFTLETSGSFLSADPSAGGLSMNYKTIAGGGDLEAVVHALEQVGETRVLATPQIACVDGAEASIKVVTEQPYVEVTVDTGTDPDEGDNITGRTYKFVEVGTMLQVTPKINDNGFITMKIRPEVSSYDPVFYDSGPNRGGVPVVTRSYAETVVVVKDGVTLIIGGMIDESRGDDISRVPLLGRIPVLGMLFRSQSVTKSTTERIVFLTPRIVTGEEPYLRSRDMKKKPKPLRVTGTEAGKPFKPVR